MRIRTLVVPVCAAAFLAGSARADVLVVKPVGGDFTDIAPAVAAAQEGDLILVHAPAAGASYGTFTIDGKSLTVSAAAGAAVKTRVITVRDLVAGQSVVLRGLEVVPKTGSGPDLEPGLSIIGCNGAVRVEDCSLLGARGVNSLGLSGDAGTSVLSSDDVGLSRCTSTGGNGALNLDNDGNGSSGGPGLYVTNSTVWVHDSQLAGGDGGDNDDFDWSPGEPAGVGNGGAGAHVFGGTLSLAGSTLAGGEGGQHVLGITLSLGGDGLHVQQGTSIIRNRDSDFAGAPGTGEDGLAIDLDGGSLLPYLPASRHLTVESPVHELTSTQLVVAGHASDVAWLLVSLTPHGAWVHKLAGPVLVGGPVVGSPLPLGTVAPDGLLPVTFSVPDLGPGLEHADVHVQLVILSDDGTTLENGSVLTLLDAAF